MRMHRRALPIHALQVCARYNVPMFFHNPGVRSGCPWHPCLDKTAFGKGRVCSWMCTHPPFLKRRMFLPDPGSHCETLSFILLPFSINQRTADTTHSRHKASLLGHLLPTTPTLGGVRKKSLKNRRAEGTKKALCGCTPSSGFIRQWKPCTCT